MILADSLQVMASRAEHEGLRGRAHCTCFDPPVRLIRTNRTKAATESAKNSAQDRACRRTAIRSDAY